MHRCSFMVYRIEINNIDIYVYDEATGKFRYVSGPDGTYYTHIPGAVWLVFYGGCHFNYITFHKKHVTPTAVQIRYMCAEDKIFTCFSSDEYDNSLEHLHITSVDATNTDDPLVFVVDPELDA